MNVKYKLDNYLKILINTYMSAVDIDESLPKLDPTETHTFSSKPVTMMYFVYVPIQGPLMEEDILDYPFRKYTET